MQSTKRPLDTASDTEPPLIKKSRSTLAPENDEDREEYEYEPYDYKEERSHEEEEKGEEGEEEERERKEEGKGKEEDNDSEVGEEAGVGGGDKEEQAAELYSTFPCNKSRQPTQQHPQPLRPEYLDLPGYWNLQASADSLLGGHQFRRILTDGVARPDVCPQTVNTINSRWVGPEHLHLCTDRRCVQKIKHSLSQNPPSTERVVRKELNSESPEPKPEPGSKRSRALSLQGFVDALQENCDGDLTNIFYTWLKARKFPTFDLEDEHWHIHICVESCLATNPESPRPVTLNIHGDYTRSGDARRHDDRGHCSCRVDACGGVSQDERRMSDWATAVAEATGIRQTAPARECLSTGERERRTTTGVRSLDWEGLLLPPPQDGRAWSTAVEGRSTEWEGQSTAWEGQSAQQEVHTPIKCGGDPAPEDDGPSPPEPEQRQSQNGQRSRQEEKQSLPSAGFNYQPAPGQWADAAARAAETRRRMKECESWRRFVSNRAFGPGPWDR